MHSMDDNAAEEASITSGYKSLPCRHCGKLMLVGAKTRKAPSHMECSIQATIENARQIREKSGPYYDKWLQGQAEYLKRLTGGGAPPEEDR